MTPVRDSRRIRVCHVQSVPLMAGAQRVMFEIVRRLDPRRFERHSVCNAEGPLTAALRDEGVECHLVPQLRRSINPWRDVQAYANCEACFRNCGPTSFIPIRRSRAFSVGSRLELGSARRAAPCAWLRLPRADASASVSLRKYSPNGTRPGIAIGSSFSTKTTTQWSIEAGVAQARQCTPSFTTESTCARSARQFIAPRNVLTSDWPTTNS